MNNYDEALDKIRDNNEENFSLLVECYTNTTSNNQKHFIKKAIISIEKSDIKIRKALVILPVLNVKEQKKDSEDLWEEFKEICNKRLSGSDYDIDRKDSSIEENNDLSILSKKFGTKNQAMSDEDMIMWQKILDPDFKSEPLSGKDLDEAIDHGRGTHTWKSNYKPKK